MKTLKKSLYFLLSVIIIILVIFLLSSIISDELIIPSPKRIFEEIIKLIQTKSFYVSALSTLLRAVISFLLAFVLALIFSLIAKKFSIFENLFYPITVIFKATPTMSFILLCLIWFRSKYSPIAISFIVIFPMLYSSSLGAMKSTDKKIIEMLDVYGVKKSKIYFMYVLPTTLSSLFPELTSILAFNVKLTIAGEALSYTKQSLGYEMQTAVANANFETARLFALTVFAILLAFLLEFFLKGITIIINKVRYEYRRKKLNEIIQR